MCFVFFWVCLLPIKCAVWMLSLDMLHFFVVVYDVLFPFHVVCSF
jgi:hypothetical protein